MLPRFPPFISDSQNRLPLYTARGNCPPASPITTPRIQEGPKTGFAFVSYTEPGVILSRLWAQINKAKSPHCFYFLNPRFSTKLSPHSTIMRSTFKATTRLVRKTRRQEEQGAEVPTGETLRRVLNQVLERLLPSRR